MKCLIGDVSLTEYRWLLDVPGVLEDDLFIDALRAWKTDVPKHILWQRLSMLQRMLQLPQWSTNLYYTYNGVVKYELEEYRVPIRKVIKYSGYVRNLSSKDKGSLGTVRPEPEIFEWNFDVKIDYFLFLTVGEFDSGLPGSLAFALMSSKDRTKR
jgi:hypothetical protein